MSLAKVFISQKKLKSIFDYNKETGDLTRKTNSKKAGWKHKNQWGKCYIRTQIKKDTMYAHNIIFIIITGALPNGVCDHIDGNGLNNKWDNLRDVTQSQNCKNTKKAKSNTSGVTGVNWHKIKKKWRVRIATKKGRVIIGDYSCFDEAVKARKQAEIKHNYHPNHGSDRPL